MQYGRYEPVPARVVVDVDQRKEPVRLTQLVWHPNEARDASELVVQGRAVLRLHVVQHLRGVTCGVDDTIASATRHKVSEEVVFRRAACEAHRGRILWFHCRGGFVGSWVFIICL